MNLWWNCLLRIHIHNILVLEKYNYTAISRWSFAIYMIQEALWLRANRFSSVPSDQISRDTPAAYLITRPTTTLWWTSRYKLDLTLLKHISLQIGSFNYTTSDHPLPLTSQILTLKNLALLHLLLILLNNQYVSVLRRRS